MRPSQSFLSLLPLVILFPDPSTLLPPPPHHPPAQPQLGLSDDAQTPPDMNGTEMRDVFSDNGDGHGFDSNDNPDLSNDAATPREIDDTESTDTQMSNVRYGDD